MAAAFQKTKYDKSRVPNHSWHSPALGRRQARELGPTPQTKAGQQEGALPHFKGCQIQVKPYLWQLGESGWLKAAHLVVPAGQSWEPPLAPAQVPVQPSWTEATWFPCAAWFCTLGHSSAWHAVGTVPQLEEHSRNLVIIFLLEPALQLCHSSSFPVTLVALLRLIMQ